MQILAQQRQFIHEQQEDSLCPICSVEYNGKQGRAVTRLKCGYHVLCRKCELQLYYTHKKSGSRLKHPNSDQCYICKKPKTGPIIKTSNQAGTTSFQDKLLENHFSRLSQLIKLTEVSRTPGSKKTTARTDRRRKAALRRIESATNEVHQPMISIAGSHSA